MQTQSKQYQKRRIFKKFKTCLIRISYQPADRDARLLGPPSVVEVDHVVVVLAPHAPVPPVIFGGVLGRAVREVEPAQRGVGGRRDDDPEGDEVIIRVAGRLERLWQREWREVRGRRNGQNAGCEYGQIVGRARAGGSGRAGGRGRTSCNGSAG